MPRLEQVIAGILDGLNQAGIQADQRLTRLLQHSRDREDAILPISRMALGAVELELAFALQHPEEKSEPTASSFPEGSPPLEVIVSADALRELPQHAVSRIRCQIQPNSDGLESANPMAIQPAEPTSAD